MVQAAPLHFLRAMNHSLTLFSAGTMMALLWCYLRLPDASFQMVIFAFLASSVLYDVDGWQNRLALVLPMAAYAAVLQFLIGICHQSKLLLVTVPAAFAFFVARTLGNRAAACCVLLVGYIGFYAGGGFLPAVNRGLGIFVAAAVVMVATSLVGLVHQRRMYLPAFGVAFSLTESIRIALALAFATFLANALKLPQGPWTMLSVIFIYMAVDDRNGHAYFAIRRIYGVPLGLVLGGLYMGCLTYFNYRFVYLVPLIGALGFFVLYYFQSYFFFTVLFMVAFSVYVDWSTGDMHEFHLRQLILARSFATVLGSSLVLLFEYYFLPASGRRKEVA